MVFSEPFGEKWNSGMMVKCLLMLLGNDGWAGRKDDGMIG